MVADYERWRKIGFQIVVNIPLSRADAAVRPYAEDLSHKANSAVVRWQFIYRNRLCRGRLPRLPAVTYLRNAYTNIRHQTSNPLPREGVAALPYTEILGGGGLRTLAEIGFQIVVNIPLPRADTAVRPYAEDLSHEANSAIVRWRFKSQNGPVARGYQVGKRVHGLLTKNTSSVSSGGRGSPPLHRIFGTFRIQNYKSK